MCMPSQGSGIDNNTGVTLLDARRLHGSRYGPACHVDVCTSTAQRTRVVPHLSLTRFAFHRHLRSEHRHLRDLAGGGLLLGIFQIDT